MKMSAKVLLLALTIGVLASLSLPVLAYSPLLSASYVGGSSSSLQILVSNANPYSQVNLSSRQSSTLWTQINNLGQTNGSGYLSQVINLPGDGSNSPLQLYVTVGGQLSSTILVYPGGYNGGGGYCNGYNCNSGTLTLSQTSLSLNAGQNSTISIYNNNNNYNYSNNYYISTNSNSSVASASVSGSTLYVSAINAGSTTITVCQNSGYAGCASVYVTVNGNNGGNNGGNVWFNPSSPTMYVGQSLAVSVNSNATGGYAYSNNNAYYVSTNSNPNVVSASVSGTALNLYASQNGSSSISVCSSGLNFCGTLYVTVTGNGGNNGGSLSLSQTNININVGQTQSVTAYNYNGGSLYVSSNSNSNAVSVTMNGAQLNFYGLASGNATISICANNTSQCASVYVTVGGGNNGGNLTFSPNNVYMNISQTSTVSVSGGGGYYISSNSNPSVVGATITGSTVYLNSLSSGSSTITVCQNLGNNQCGSFYVTVSGYGTGNNSTLWFSQNTVNLNYAQTQNVTIYSNNNSGTYYISSNSNPSTVTATVYSNQLSLNGNTNGNSTITVCQNSSGSSCGTVYVTVGGGGTGCYYNCGGYNGGSISLSQTSLQLNLGQSASVTLYGSGNYYISTNSNPGVASVTVSGSTVNVYAGSNGSTTVSICQNTNSGCASLYVTVGGGYNGNGGYGSNTVNIGDEFFSPKNISVAAGTTVVWTNSGNMVHTVTADDNSFTSGNINPGQSYSHTFTSAGNFAYHCIFHGGIGGVGMSGVVTVGGNGGYYGGGSVGGASTYQNGALISENGTISLIYHNLKTAFASASAFLGLGFSFDNVVNVGNSGLPSSGYAVTTWRSQHPWGSWVKDGGNTVYFVHQLGLIPVPDWSTFLNNGGQANWIVRANSWDFSLPILSTMTSNDGRLR